MGQKAMNINFADDIETLKYYNQVLGYPMIFGGSYKRNVYGISIRLN